jgi:DNA polymerase III epsilon subunit-like protein
MSFFMVDVEANGPIPGTDEYSMIEVGAVLIDNDKKLDSTFYRTLSPISDNYNQGALDVTGHTHEETLDFGDPYSAMVDFKDWVNRENVNGRPILISDNNGFDFMFTHWYFMHFLQEDPFGYSSARLADYWHGIKRNAHASFKYLRKTKHTHNPVDDAKGNAEAFLYMIKKYDIKGVIK